MADTITNPLTAADLEHYEKLIKSEGTQGVEKAYHNMISRGYYGANWSLNGYSRHTELGLTNLNQIERQNGDCLKSIWR